MSKNVGEHLKMKPALRTDALGRESAEFFSQLLFLDYFIFKYLMTLCNRLITLWHSGALYITDFLVVFTNAPVWFTIIDDIIV